MVHYKPLQLTCFVIWVLFAIPTDIDGRRPPKVDLCIVLATKSIHASLSRGIGEISTLIQKVSISPSTTRVALITAYPKVKQRLQFRSCVNRECVGAKLKNLRRTLLRHSSRSHVSNLKKSLLLALKIFKGESRKDAKKYILVISEKSSNRKTLNRFGKILKKQKIILALKVLTKHQDGFMVFQNGEKQLARLPFAKESYTSCKISGVVYDECNRKCYCMNGQMTKCARVRKEFTEMTIPERRRYISAFKKLASDPRYKKRHEAFVKIHKDLFFKGIHTQNYFLPWHRWYMLTFENLIREVDCRITLPYWDWAFWSKVPWVSNIHIWNSHDYGLGGNGDPKKGYCVQDGPFKEGSFKTPEFDNEGKVLDAVAYALDKGTESIPKTPNKPGCLRRSFNGKPIGVPEVKKILRNRAASFSIFEQLVRVSLHNSIHNEIGGHMCSEYASVTPEFFLHHTFLDKLWYTWQQHSKACLTAKFAHSNQKMKKFKCHHSQREMIDSSKLPGHVNVTYTDYYYKYENKRNDDEKEAIANDSSKTLSENSVINSGDAKSQGLYIADAESSDEQSLDTKSSSMETSGEDSSDGESSDASLDPESADAESVDPMSWLSEDNESIVSSDYDENSLERALPIWPPYEKVEYDDYISKTLG